MKGLLFVDFKIYKVYFDSNTGFRAILRSNDKNHYKQGDRDDNEAGTGSAETLEPLSRFIERSCAGRTGQGLAGRIPPDDTEAAAYIVGNGLRREEEKVCTNCVVSA